MPFSFNFKNFGRWNRQPVIEKPPAPTGLAPPYNAGGVPFPPNGPAYTGMQPMQPPMGPPNAYMPQSDTRSSTSNRLNMTTLSACCLLVTVIFVIMVEIGNTRNKAVLRDIWFIKLHFANINPAFNNTPGLGFGLAESLGLYDFYQVGLWNYAEGWNSTGIAYVSPPKANFWWNPIEMFGDQIAGYNATDSFSESLTSSFDEIERCSHWMFGLFMTGACLSFFLIPFVILGMKSRWFSLGLSIITFLNMVCVLAATIIATVVFVLIRDLLKDYEEIINLVPEIGSTMFAMMWISAAFSIFAFLIQVFLSCFCASQRDVKRGTTKTEAYLW